MTNNHSSLEFSPVTYNLPTLLFEMIPPWVNSILTRWNSMSIGPQLKVCIYCILYLTILVSKCKYICMQFVIMIK